MRTIKFKGTCIGLRYGGNIAFGSLVAYPDGTTRIFEYGQDGSFNNYSVDPDTACQFTGLFDKNGEEIYEGDVLRSDDYPFSSIQDNEIDNYYGVMFWSHEETAFNVMCVKNIKSSSVRTMTDGYSYFFSKDSSQDFEVIGNIHDPEWKQYIKFFQEAYNEQHQ